MLKEAYPVLQTYIQIIPVIIIIITMTIVVIIICSIPASSHLHILCSICLALPLAVSVCRVSRYVWAADVWGWGQEAAGTRMMLQDLFRISLWPTFHAHLRLSKPSRRNMSSESGISNPIIKFVQ